MTGGIGARPIAWQASRSFKSTSVKSMSPAYDSQAGILSIGRVIEALDRRIIGMREHSFARKEIFSDCHA
jgi:hypothetical protein